MLVQWDDDDWYSSSRLRREVAPLAAGVADISGILHGFMLDTGSMRFWRGELPLHEGRLHAVIVAGTLAFTRAACQRAGGYPDRSIGEEVALLEAVLRNHGRVASIVNDGIYICVRHGANSWRLRFDAIEGPPGWTEVPTPDFLPAGDLEFYRSLEGGPPQGSPAVCSAPDIAHRRGRQTERAWNMRFVSSLRRTARWPGTCSPTWIGSS